MARQDTASLLAKITGRALHSSQPFRDSAVRSLKTARRAAATAGSPWQSRSVRRTCTSKSAIYGRTARAGSPGPACHEEELWNMPVTD